MLRQWMRGAISLCGFFLFAQAARAQTLGTSARQMPAGSLKTLVYYQGVDDQELAFKVNGAGSCVGAPPSSASFPCQGGEIDGEGSGGAVMAKVIWQPWDTLQYYAAFGAGNYTLRTGSVTVTNVLTGDRPGFLYQVGTRAILVPDTIVTPGVAIDASLGWQRYYFNEMRPAPTAAEGQIDQRLDLMQTQVAVIASHLFTFSDSTVGLEPYGGVKWLRTQAWLKDLRAGGRSGGKKDMVSPVVGVQIPFYERESFFAEATFVDGIQYAVGLAVRFGGDGKSKT